MTPMIAEMVMWCNFESSTLSNSTIISFKIVLFTESEDGENVSFIRIHITSVDRMTANSKFTPE